MSSNLFLDAELNKRIGKAATAMSRLAKRVWNNHTLTTITKMQVYQACVPKTSRMVSSPLAPDLQEDLFYAPRMSVSET